MATVRHAMNAGIPMIMVMTSGKVVTCTTVSRSRRCTDIPMNGGILNCDTLMFNNGAMFATCTGRNNSPPQGLQMADQSTTSNRRPEVVAPAISKAAARRRKHASVSKQASSEAKIPISRC